MTQDVAISVVDVAPDLPPAAGETARAPAMAVPVAAAPVERERRRNTSTVRRSDVLALAGAAGSAVSLTSIVYFWLAPFTGVLGFIVIAYAFFLALYGLLVATDESGPAVRDRLAGAVVHSIGFLLLLALVTVVTYTAWRGRSAVRNTGNFFTEDLSRAGPLDPLDVGGVAHAIVGTLEQISIALVLTVPLGILCAVFLNQIPGRFSRIVRTLTEAASALPSIIAGLFIYATFIIALGGPSSGFAASLAISVMMLPIIIRAADVVLRLVPGNLIEASYALGSSQWRTVWHVVLPTARSGLATAVILGTARGIGETSPVLLTAGYTTRMTTNPFDGAQVSLPLATFQLTRAATDEVIARGFGAGLTLLVLVLILFVVARLIGGRGPGQLSRRQERARRRASVRDVRRFEAREIAGVAAPGQQTTEILDLLDSSDPSDRHHRRRKD